MSRVGSAVGETKSSLAVVFRNPGLRRINLAFAGSAIGDWAYATAIVVWAYSIGGVTAVGIWGTTRLILMTLVTPFAATLVDRFPRKSRSWSPPTSSAPSSWRPPRVLIWADAEPIAVFVVATLASLVATPFRPAVAALIPKLVDRPEELTAANGASSTIESLAFFVGPALGGILLTVFDVEVVIVFNAVTFLWSALLVSRIRVPASSDEEPGYARRSRPATPQWHARLWTPAVEEAKESFRSESMRASRRSGATETFGW